MSEATHRRVISKRRKVTCSKCNETFDHDYTKKHMLKHHPKMVAEGKTPGVFPVKESDQPTLSSFFSPSSSKSDQPSTSKESQEEFHEPQPSTSLPPDDVVKETLESDNEPFDIPEVEYCDSPANTKLDSPTQDMESEQIDDENLPFNVIEEEQCITQEEQFSPPFNADEESDSSSDDENDNEAKQGIGADLNDDIPTVNQNPNQPILPSYPMKEIRGRQRCFRADWYAKHAWIEYDFERDEVSCFSCKHFGKPGHQTFTSSFWIDRRKLIKHETSKNHEFSMVRWISSKDKSQTNTILEPISEKHKKEIDQNRAYLKVIIESLVFLAKQNVPSRGRVEDRTNIAASSDTNRGNFIELLSLRCRDIPWLESQFDQLWKKHRQWTAPMIQNEILALFSKFVLDRIITQIQASGPYSIIADETSDVSNLEQVSLYVRFVQEGKIHENFIGFLETPSTTGQSLFDLIKTVLESHSLDFMNLVGQGYDGASNMSSQKVGVSGLMQKVAPKAIYVHCYGHQLNLCTQKSMTQVKSFRNCLGTVQEMYCFIEASPKRHALFQEVQTRRSESKVTLKSQSKTRWSCRKESTSAVRKRLPATLETLLNVDESDPKLTTKCNGLINNLLSFDFIFSLLIVDDILGTIDGLSKFLQSENMDVFQARNSAFAVIETLKKGLHDESFDTKWEEAMKIANDLKQIINNHSLLHFKEPVLPRNSSYSDVKQYYKSSLHDAGLNHSISELEACFDKPQQEVICALTKIVMQPAIVGVEKEADTVSEFYGIDKLSLLSERKIVATSITVQKKENVLTATYELIKWLHEAGISQILPTYYAALKILASIPTTSCSAERSFSALRRIKTYLRNRISEERLSAVAILNIEREATNYIEANHMEEIINEFAMQNEERAKFFVHIA